MFSVHFQDSAETPSVFYACFSSSVILTVEPLNKLLCVKKMLQVKKI